MAKAERMSDLLENTYEETVRLRRPPPRVFTDPCGHNVWMGEVEVLDLELVQVESTDPYNSAETDSRWSKY